VLSGFSNGVLPSCATPLAIRSFSAATIDTTTEPSDSSNLNTTESAHGTKRIESNETNKLSYVPKKSAPSQEYTSLLPPVNEEEYDPRHVIEQIKKAHCWNQGKTPGEPFSTQWDYGFVRSSVDLYERHLQYVMNYLKSKGPNDNNDKTTNSSTLFADIHSNPQKCNDTNLLLAPRYLAAAVRALTRSKLDTPILSQRIRNIECLIGSIGWTPITEGLSYRLLEANGKAGNVRRALALLELRRRRGYETKEREFIHVITSIQSAQLQLRRSRNIYLHESALPESSLDNPTRYLDAILVNMSQRGVRLTPDLAAIMLSCYSSSGRTGRAIHYFYKIHKDPIEADGIYIPGPHPTHLGKDDLEEWKKKKRDEGMGRRLLPRHMSSAQTNDQEAKGAAYEELEAMQADDEEMNLKYRTRMSMRPGPPYHKIPSAVKGLSLSQSRNQEEVQQSAMKTLDRKQMTKLESELERDWSLALTAAFAFADSLTHGACGHDPIELNLSAWNALIKACCYRGALHRALKILNETLPQKGIDPDSYSYNTILAALARVVSTKIIEPSIVIIDTQWKLSSHCYPRCAG
jgi:hypothetical protein